jgi:DNA-binding MarR family transcriptional regulator/PKD repeat protein
MKDRPAFPLILKGMAIVLIAVILVPSLSMIQGSGTGSRIGKPNLTIWAVQVDPNIIGQGVLEYPATYDSDDYIDEQTTMDVSDEVPNEGETVLINLTVFNIGFEEGSAEVEFYDGPMETGTFIGRDRVEVSSFSYDIAHSSWDTTGVLEEEHEIFAYLIPDDPENETDPENNQGSKEILINFYPHARISGFYVDGVLSAEVSEGDTVLFDGSSSSDTQRDMEAGLVFKWNFGDPNSNETNPNMRSDVNLTYLSHVFGDSGSYEIDLTITDQNGASRTDMMSINVTNRAPEPDFEPRTTTFLEDEVIIFDAGTTMDSDHDLALMEYRWDMGDGTTTTWSNSPLIEHSYPASGEYQVTLRVRDDEGIEGRISRDIEVLSVEPLALIESAEVNGEEVSVSEGEIEVDEDDLIHLVGRPEDTPSDIDELNYFWKIGGGTTKKGDEVDLVLTKSGEKRISFFVADDDQAVSSAELKIFVRNLDPIAVAGEDMTLTTSIVSLNGSGSTDTPSDLENLTYIWNMGDGTILRGMTVHHEYDGKGSYEVVLTVEDDDGARSSDRLMVHIENLAPEPMIDGPNTAKEDEIFTLDGSKSKDKDGEIRSYYWTLPDGREVQGSTLAHAFHSSGEHTILFNVRDDDGALSKLFWNIYIENVEPRADAGEDNETVIGLPAVLDGSRSDDTASDMRNLTYTWMTENGTIFSGRIVEIIFEDEGEHVIQLTVMDPEGLISIDTILIWVFGSVLESIEMVINMDPQKCGPDDQITISGKVSFEFSGPVDERGIGLAVIYIHVDGSIYAVYPDRTGMFELIFSAPEEQGNYEVRCTINRLGLFREESFKLIVEAGDQELAIIAFATSPAGIVTGSAVVLIGGGFALAMSTDIGRWKFFLLLIPLFSRIKRDEVLDNFERGRIYQYILINPGDYFSHIKEMLDLNSGTLTYHLKVLEQREFIKSRTDGRVKRFYPYSMKVDGGPHRDIQTRILELLAFNPNLTQKEIARALGIHVSTVNYHINMMVGAGLLRSDRTDRVQRYEVQYIAQEIPAE